MSKSKKTYDKELDFNGGWTIGEAQHHIGKKTTTQTHKSKKQYIFFRKLFKKKIVALLETSSRPRR